MKILLSTIFTFFALLAFAQENVVRTYYVNTNDKSSKENTPDQLQQVPTDSVRLQINNGIGYYQQVVKLDSTVAVNTLYVRILQFMAAKNYQLNYGNQQDGKMIFVTNQDLNNNATALSDSYDPTQPYTVQFSIELDLKPGRYKYTVSNIVFFQPANELGNRRFNMYDIYLKTSNPDSKRVARDARAFIASFERYLASVVTEMHLAAQKKLIVSNLSF